LTQYPLTPYSHDVAHYSVCKLYLTYWMFSFEAFHGWSRYVTRTTCY
jgi:hypothetical protein